MTHHLSRWLPRSLRATPTRPIRRTRLGVAELEDRTVPATPVAAADSFWTSPDTPLTVAAPGVLDNDSDADGDPLRTDLASGPAHGTLALNPNGSFTYTPAAGYTGTDSFTYRAREDVAGPTWERVGPAGGPARAIAVSPNYADDQTVAFGSNYQPGRFFRTTDGGTTWTSTQPLGAASNFHVFDAIAFSPGYQTGGADQTVFLGGGNSAWVYRSADGGVTWSRSTTGATSGDLSVWEVGVSPAYATDHTVFAAGNNGVHKSTDGGVNWSPLATGQPAVGSQYAVVPSPAYASDHTLFAGGWGGLVRSTDGGATWTRSDAGLPASPGNPVTVVSDVALSPAYATDHTILAAVQSRGLYRSTDGGATWAQVSDSPPISFQGLAFSPAFATDQTVFYRGLSGTVLMSRDAGDSWVTLPMSGLSGAAASSVNSMAVSPNFASDGRVFVGTQNDGVWSVDTRLPIPQQSAAATVSILVGNPPPVAAADSATTPEDTPVTIPVLANDTDPNGQPMTAVVFAQPGSGSVAAGAGGALVFTPAANFAGTATFTYRAFDGSGYSAVTTVTVTVTAVNDLPVPDYTFNEYTYEDTPREYVRPTWYPVGSDADGDALSVVLETDVQHGTLVLQPNGSFTYTPDADYSGPDGFTVRVTDGQALSADVGTVTMTVYPVNDPPVAGNDAFVTDEETPVAGNLFGNDSDPVEGDPLLYWSVQDYPLFGNAVPGPDGELTYYPYPDFFGTDTFTYVVYDEYSGTHSAPATVTITVHGTPDAPVALGDGYAVVAGDTLVVAAPDGVVANDTDVDLEALSAVLDAGPAHGTLTLNADGSFAYTPDAGFLGTDTFTYRATDGLLESEPVVVEIVVGTQAVTTLLDVVDAGDGVVSLREAIDAANLNPGPDRIGFNVRGFIDVTGPLPALSDPTGGTTIVGYVPAGLAPAVGVRGPTGGDGFVITSANNELRGLLIGTFETAVRVTGPDATGNVIAGNSIGVSYDPINGWLDVSNFGVGILVEDAPGNRVGSAGIDGPTGRNLLGYNQAGAIVVTGAGATANVIAGNDVGGRRRTADWDYDGFGNPGVGITVQAPGTVVGGTGPDEDNFVAGSHVGVWVQGANAAGTRVVGNVVVDNFTDGVDVEGVAGIEVVGNVISGNGNWGVFVYGADTFSTYIQSNHIGTDANGWMDWGNQNDGIYVLDAPGTLIGGAGGGNHISANYGNGVRIEGLAAVGTVVEANVIGVGYDQYGGELSLRNWAGGVVVTNAPDTLVADNLISGNEDGYAVSVEGINSTNTVIRGNTIGTNAGGFSPLPNYEGITAYDSPGLVVEDNLISGNHASAVNVSGPAGGTVVIRGNRIGVDVSGNGALGNGDWGSDGSVVVTGEVDVVLGGSGPGEGNVIAGDLSGYGVYIRTTGAVLVVGNHIGVGVDTGMGIGNASAGLALDVSDAVSVEVTGNVISHNYGPGVAVFYGYTPATPVIIRSNRMYINDGPSIDLGYDGQTYNDYDPDSLPPDQDEGPNGFQNHPDLTAAHGTWTSLTVEGVLHSTPDTTFTVEFYAAGEDFGYAYIERLLGTVELTTDADGAAPFNLTLATYVADGEWITSTATGPEGTSEVSPRVWLQFEYDSDGVEGVVEDGGPNGGDGNGDGTLDSQQENVASLPNAVDTRYVTVAAPADTSLAEVASGTPPPDLPAGVNLPFGTLDFAVAGLAPGAAAEVTIYLPAGVVVDAYYKFGPEAGDPTPHWYAFTYDGNTGAELFPGRIVLHFVDSGRGDDDGAADGRVTDPGAPVQFLSAHTVTVRGSVLSDPAASQYIQVVNADVNSDVSGYFSGDRTLTLAPAVYEVFVPNGPGGQKSYGTFTVASDLSLVNATGALVVDGDAIGFDLSLLTTVTLDPTGLSVGGLFQYVILNSVANPTTRVVTFHLPDGEYTVSVPNGPGGPKDYGTFTVAGGITGLTGALTLTAADAIGFDTTQLATVTLDPTGLSDPFGLQYAILNSVGDPTTAARTFHLPAGEYTVSVPNGPGGPKDFGTFTVAADLSITDVTGALLVSPAGLVTFDLTKLAAVVFDPTILSGGVPDLQLVEISSLGFGTVRPVTYHAPAGTYTVSTGNGPFGPKDYGTFTVTTALELGDFTGILVAGAGGIDFALCDLNRLRVTPQPGVTVQISGATYSFSSTTDIALPDGMYRVDVYTSAGMTSYDVAVGGGAASPAAVPEVTFTPLGCLYGVSIDTDGYVGHYSIDGGPDRYGAAALDLTPGPHTLELWGLVVPFHVDGAGRVVSDAPAAATVVGHTLRLNTATVTVERNGYGGYLNLLGLPQTGADPAFVLVRGLANYTLSLGGNAFFRFDLDAAGNVTSQNAAAATGIGSTLRLTTTTVTIERNGYDGYLANSSYHVSVGGDQVLVLVPGLSGYVINFGGNASISINLDAAGNVTSGNTAAATVIGSVLRLHSVTVAVDPADYVSYYSLTSTHPFAATSYRLVRNVDDYLIGFAENALVSFGVNADGTVTSHAPGALAADGSTLRFLTSTIQFDPGTYAGAYSLGVTTQFSVSGVWDVVLVSGVADYHLDGPAGFLAHFALDATGAPVPTVLNVTIDGNGETFTLSKVNRAPVVAGDAADTAQGSAVTVAVLANDRDRDGDALTVSAVTHGAHGTVSVNANGTVTYTPAASFYGTDTFTYTAADGHGGSATGTVIVSVHATGAVVVAVDPGAFAEPYLVVGGGSLVTGATTASLLPGTHQVALRYMGSFAFTVDDLGRVTSLNPTAATGGTGTLTFHTTTVTIDPGALTGTYRTPLVPFGVTGVQALVAVPGLAGYWVTVASSDLVFFHVGAGGAVTSQNPVAATGVGSTLQLNTVTVTVDPAAYVAIYRTELAPSYLSGVQSLAVLPGVGGYALQVAGSDPFRFDVSAAGVVTSQNPTAATATGSTLRFNTVVLGIDPGTYTGTYRTEAAPFGVSGRQNVTVLPNLGNYFLSLDAGGSLRFGVDAAGAPVPAAVPVGPYTFTFVAGGILLNSPPTPGNDSATTPEDTPKTIAVLANDTDPDGDALAVSAFTSPAHGVVVLNANGTFSYTPAANFSGTDSFTYTVTDGNGETATATVTVTVTPVNDAPTAANRAYNVAEDGALVVAATAGLLVGAADTDGDALVVSAVNGATAAVGATVATTRGTVKVLADGSFTYAPGAGCDAATDTFTFTVSDGHGGTVTATVTITIAQYTGVTRTGGVLRVGGTAGNDVVTVSGGNLIVNGTAHSLAGVTEVRVWGRAGNDRIDLSGLSVGAIVVAGAGNDDVTGGAGNDVLLGGDGDDIITGASGHDVLVGGFGSDRLVGASGNDVLVAGSTGCSAGLAALRQLGAEWAASQATTQAEEEAVEELVTDGEFDKLTGSSGADWFVISVGDQITDLPNNPGHHGDVVTYVV